MHLSCLLGIADLRNVAQFYQVHLLPRLHTIPSKEEYYSVVKQMLLEMKPMPPAPRSELVSSLKGYKFIPSALSTTNQNDDFKHCSELFDPKCEAAKLYLPKENRIPVAPFHLVC